MIPLENLDTHTRYIFYVKSLSKGGLVDRPPPIRGFFKKIMIEKSGGTNKLGIVVETTVSSGHRIRTFIPNVQLRDITVDRNED